MRRYFDSIAVVLGLLLAAAAMAGTMSGSGYARAVVAEARGYDALFRAAQGLHCEPAAMSGKTLLAANEVDQ